MAAERYFSVCTMGDCECSDTTNVTQQTTAGTYNTTRQPGAIRIAGNGSNVTSFIESPPFVDAANPTTINFVFNHYINNASTAANGGAFCEAYNSTGVVVFRIRTTIAGGSGNVAEYWNGATYTQIGAAFGLSLSTLNRIHVALVCGASGSCSVHVGGILKATGSITSASMNHVSKVRLHGISATGGEQVHYGEFAGANFDLRDLTIRYDAPTGNSATNTAWTGDFNNVDEANRDDTDMISSGTTTQRESYTHGAFTVPGGQALDSVWVAGRGRVSGTGPTDAKYMIRQGGVNYDSSALALVAGFQARARYWATDPNTSAAWTQTGYNNAEFGAVSI